MSSHDWGYGETDAEAGSREEMNANLDRDEWERELVAVRLGRDVPMRCSPELRRALDDIEAGRRTEGREAA